MTTLPGTALISVLLATVLLTACGGGGGGTTATTPLDSIEIVSVNVFGAPATGNSSDCGESCTNLSDDGRFFSFRSSAADIVLADTNGMTDVFLRDTGTDTTIRISEPNLSDQGTLGNQADGNSDNPSVNSSGRFVVFDSDASNLVLDDLNTFTDVFIHDTSSGLTERVSLPNRSDQLTLGTEANRPSERPCVSDNGRYIGFQSDASNLVLNDTNGQRDVFRHDRSTGETIRVSVHTSGVEGNSTSSECSISADGSVIAFASFSSTLVDSDTNGNSDIFFRDIAAGTTTRVSVNSAGAQALGGHSSNPAITADGRYVVWWSSAINLVGAGAGAGSNIYRRDRTLGETIVVSVPNPADQGTLGAVSNASAQYPAISDDGRFVVYSTSADNMVLNDANAEWDIFVYDVQLGITARVNVDSNGNEMTTGFVSDWAGISGDGRYINFYGSGAPGPNIVTGDTNNSDDAYRAPNPLYPDQ